MPDVIAVGSVGLDSIKTPFGEVKDELGGTAVNFAIASSVFSKTGIVSVAGLDAKKQLDLLAQRGICTKGLQMVMGKTMQWHCYYEYDMNEAHTTKTELNAFGSFSPVLPEEYRRCRFVFIGAIDPSLQVKVLNQLEKPEFVVVDTKDFWIDRSRKTFLEAAGQSTLLLLNEWEARHLFQTSSLMKAAKEALKLGPEYVIIKKGEHGSLLFSDGNYFVAPGYPLENIIDPTGAGDSYAGALMGWLANQGKVTEPNLRKAMIYGAVVASFTVEDFGLRKLASVTTQEIEKRYQEIKRITCFD
ncbi:MAG TPA: PfkB family carbohydrate kinase [archaeon]|nr:PfkB family carbohydrate kinase [archaeon]